MTYTPIIFEHPDYGTLVVIQMADDKARLTDDIEQAMFVLCPAPGGAGMLTACASEGKLMRIKRLH
jgi:hypothetical protein